MPNPGASMHHRISPVPETSAPARPVGRKPPDLSCRLRSLPGPRAERGTAYSGQTTVTQLRSTNYHKESHEYRRIEYHRTAPGRETNTPVGWRGAEERRPPWIADWGCWLICAGLIALASAAILVYERLQIYVATPATPRSATSTAC